jgi:hypothetical protein
MNPQRIQLTRPAPLIPAKITNQWTRRAKAGDLLKLENMIEFRQLCKDEGYREEGVLMQAYSEAARAMFFSAETLRDLMGKIREYTPAQLKHWIRNGVSFDHLEKANLLAETARKTPMQLLDECIELGNEHGETMTVREMVAHAIGEIKLNGKQGSFHWLPLYDRLGKFPMKLSWDDEKSERWNTWLETGKEFFA